MNKDEFISTCTNVFREYGFKRKGRNYYLDFQNDLLLIFGLQKSAYGCDYYYINYGFAIKSVNAHMPFPKDYEANLDCGRVTHNGNPMLEYPDMTEADLRRALHVSLLIPLSVGMNGLQALIDTYIETKKCCWIVGKKAAELLGTDPEKALPD